MISEKAVCNSISSLHNVAIHGELMVLRIIIIIHFPPSGVRGGNAEENKSNLGVLIREYIKAENVELLDFTLSDVDFKFSQRPLGQAKASLS